MAQQLKIYQSLWAMERRRPDADTPEGAEWGLDRTLAMIRDAGFDGVGCGFADTAMARTITGFCRDHGMSWEAQCYPRTVDDLAPILDTVGELGCDHVNLQPDIRPRRLIDCIPLVEGWRRLAERAGVPVHMETHRDRMTTDLHFTLDLLDCFPDLRLTADLSHFVVGREFAWPIDDENHAQMRRVLDQSWGFHGRVASREQVQLQLGFAQHRKWVELFMGWWEQGFRSWRRRAGPDAVLTFLCELGPPDYAMTGADGFELSDRWEETQALAGMVRALWNTVASEPAGRGDVVPAHPEPAP